MCGRYVIRHPLGSVVESFAATIYPKQTDLFGRFNVAPSQGVPAVKLIEKGRELLGLAWGFRPFWSTGKGLAPINARAETVGTSRMFAPAFKLRRCLLPVDGFYEWKRAGKVKVPHFFHMADDSLFSFAGIYEGDTCCHITTTPNEMVGKVHDRMPVMLLPDQFVAWLNPKTSAAKLHEMLNPLPAELMDEYEVSTRVNSPKNEGPELVTPADV